MMNRRRILLEKWRGNQKRKRERTNAAPALILVLDRFLSRVSPINNPKEGSSKPSTLKYGAHSLVLTPSRSCVQLAPVSSDPLFSTQKGHRARTVSCSCKVLRVPIAHFPLCSPLSLSLALALTRPVSAASWQFP